jgi:endonuclease/exonuclease/phosphatase family metal-dependent hydrolase
MEIIMQTLKIMSFNTQHCSNYITKKFDYPIIADTIRRYDPDVVVLNEMRGAGEKEDYVDQTNIIRELVGMPYCYFAKAIDVCDITSPYGNAILSKLPFVSVETVHIPDPPKEGRIGTHWYEHRCFLKAVLSGGITVLGVHIGLNPEEKELAIKTLCEHIASEKCLLLGDFNMRPTDEKLDPIKARMHDAAELFTEELLSCPSDEPKGKIDYIFATPDVKFVSADIPAIVASDHRPHVATVNI